jgi:hypothetical protein
VAIEKFVLCELHGARSEGMPKTLGLLNRSCAPENRQLAGPLLGGCFAPGLSLK